MELSILVVKIRYTIYRWIVGLDIPKHAVEQRVFANLVLLGDLRGFMPSD